MPNLRKSRLNSNPRRSSLQSSKVKWQDLVDLHTGDREEVTMLNKEQQKEAVENSLHLHQPKNQEDDPRRSCSLTEAGQAIKDSLLEINKQQEVQEEDSQDPLRETEVIVRNKELEDTAGQQQQVDSMDKQMPEVSGEVMTEQEEDREEETQGEPLKGAEHEIVDKDLEEEITGGRQEEHSGEAMEFSEEKIVEGQESLKEVELEVITPVDKDLEEISGGRQVDKQVDKQMPEVSEEKVEEEGQDQGGSSSLLLPDERNVKSPMDQEDDPNENLENGRGVEIRRKPEETTTPNTMTEIAQAARNNRLFSDKKIYFLIFTLVQFRSCVFPRGLLFFHFIYHSEGYHLPCNIVFLIIKTHPL